LLIYFALLHSCVPWHSTSSLTHPTQRLH
jgi:hypothetical protein